MLFDTLVLTCLCRGTAYGESGKKIRIEPDANERVIFFEIDENSNEYSSFRRDFNVDGPICDLIIFYTPHDSRDCTKVLCFAELKGINVKHAVNQVMATYQAIKDEIPQDYRSEIKWKGYILTRGSAPKDTKRLKAELISRFGRGNGDISTTEEIGHFLRS